MKQDETNIRTRYARSYIPNAVFYIPFGYYYAVRLGTVPKLLSWMLIYLMPTAFYAAVDYSGSWTDFAVNYLLVLIACFSLYEYGYIYNDTVSIRHEQQPALRLYDYNMVHFNRFRPLISCTRLLYTVTALSLLFYLNTTETALKITVSISILCALFSIYNKWRSYQNVWLYPFLVCSRYLPFMLLSEHHWTVYLMLLFSFPLLNAIERFSMPRYRWPWIRTILPNEASKTLFRVIYYIVILLVATLILYGQQQSFTLLLPICLLGVYRLSLLFWLKRHTPTNYLNG